MERVHRKGLPTRPGRPRPRRDAEGGMSVVEVIVALAVIGTVMTAMLPFLVGSVVSIRQQSGEQTAVEVTNDALERARALKPSSLLVGRGEVATKQQWLEAPVQALPYLATMTQEWDRTAQPADVTVPLPTEANEVTIHGVKYSQNWYVGWCWQPRLDPTQIAVAAADCAPASGSPTDVPFFQVVVAVTWQAPAPVSQGSCIRGVCAYVAATLLSRGTDPIFDIQRPPPTITNPGNQLSYVGDTVNLLLAATGGWLPRIWTTPTGLPAGLSLNAGTGAITGTPTTPTSTPFSITVVVTDRDNKTDDVTFTWAIAEPPVLTSPADQTSRIGTAVSLPVPLTGGHAPLVWSATGLPPGLSINTSTGVITGNPTTEAQTMRPVTVTVVDGKKSLTVAFGWRVLTPIVVPVVPTQNFASGSNASNFTVRVTGGLPPYTWTATGLPDGFVMSSGGVVTGIAANGTRFVVTAIATDSAGGTGTLIVVCNVSPQSNELEITNQLADRSSKVGVVITGSATAKPSAGSNTWSATGLPPGVTISAGGVFGGTPTTVGKYLTTLTVVAPSGKKARTMFVWTVTP